MSEHKACYLLGHALYIPENLQEKSPECVPHLISTKCVATARRAKCHKCTGHVVDTY